MVQINCLLNRHGRLAMAERQFDEDFGSFPWQSIMDTAQKEQHLSMNSPAITLTSQEKASMLLQLATEEHHEFHQGSDYLRSPPRPLEERGEYVPQLYAAIIEDRLDPL